MLEGPVAEAPPSGIVVPVLGMGCSYVSRGSLAGLVSSFGNGQLHGCLDRTATDKPEREALPGLERRPVPLAVETSSLN